jgi:hypothetical protein
MTTTQNAVVVDRTMRDTLRRSSCPSGPARNECWGALILCHGDLYEAERLEEPGTPWQLVRVRDGRDLGWHSSLKRCQIAVARPINVSPGGSPLLSSPIRWLFESMAGRTLIDMRRAEWAEHRQTASQP